MFSTTLIDKNTGIEKGITISYRSSDSYDGWQVTIYDPELKNFHGHRKDMICHSFDSPEDIAVFLLTSKIYKPHLSFLKLLGYKRKEWIQMDMDERIEAIVKVVPKSFVNKVPIAATFSSVSA